MFGRRQHDEDPFAALKQGGTYESPPSTFAPPPVAPAALPRRRTRPAWLAPIAVPLVLRLLIALFVIAAVAIPLAAVKHSISSLKVPALTFGQSPTAPGSSIPPQQARADYLQQTSLRAALARVSRVVPDARVSLLRVDATSFNVIASRPGRAVKQIYFGPAGTVITSADGAGEAGIPIGQVKVEAVGRIVTDMRRRFHIPVSRIDYIVLSTPPGLSPGWIAFTKTPAHPGYQATLRGTGLRRLGQ